MSKRLALTENGMVLNVAEFPDDWDGGTWETFTATPVPGDPPVEAGWTYSGGIFTPPPTHTLTGIPRITSTETALVVYRNTFADAPASVTFDVNGATSTVALTDGIAEVEVTPSGPGPITITAVDRPVEPVTITVEEA